MSLCQPVGGRSRLLGEIDALLRALRNLHHWTAAAEARAGRLDDQGQRLLVTALRLQDEAWADCLRTAYRLFEIDAIHQAWLEAEGPRHAE